MKDRAEFWIWTMRAIGLIAVSFIVVTIVMEMLNLFQLGIQPQARTSHGLATAFLVFPGLILSLGISHAILLSRQPRRVTPMEKGLIAAIGALTFALIFMSFVDLPTILAIFVWIILIGVAISLTVVIWAEKKRVIAPANPN